MRLNLVLIGPPGSGKGTQAFRLARQYGILHISTGDILRQAVKDETPLGREVGAVMARGALVGDTLMADLVRDRLGRPDAAAGVILDGFPRTVSQARTLDDIAGTMPLMVIHIDVPGDAIIQRLSSRRVCDSCGITQSVSDPDAQPESCPYCGGTLVRRADDDIETVRRRLATYASFSEPVLAYYRQRRGFIPVNGLRPPDHVTSAIVRAIDDFCATLAD